MFKKILIILIITLLLSVVIFYINLASSFSYQPPSTELELSPKEINWKKRIEQKYDCKFEFIGLDNSFMEDSIIYMRIYCNENSTLNKLLDEELNHISLQFSKSFLKT